MDYGTIWLAAVGAAEAAAKAENEKLGPEGMRGLDCGFGWVTVKKGQLKFVNWCKKCGIGSRHSDGWTFWGSRLHSVNTQSVSVHYAAARACADVLKANGIVAYANSRLD